MFTSHGHQIIGTVAEAARPKAVARCGGPGLCVQCSREAARATGETHSEDTMELVYWALGRAGLADVQITAAINEMQNAGILFRERVGSDG